MTSAVNKILGYDGCCAAPTAICLLVDNFRQRILEGNSAWSIQLAIFVPGGTIIAISSVSIRTGALYQFIFCTGDREDEEYWMDEYMGEGSSYFLEEDPPEASDSSSMTQDERNVDWSHENASKVRRRQASNLLKRIFRIINNYKVSSMADFSLKRRPLNILV